MDEIGFPRFVRGLLEAVFDASLDVTAVQSGLSAFSCFVSTGLGETALTA